jgi:hypothetical protein
MFTNISTKPNKLYVPQEGEVDGYYWTTNAYLPQNIEYMKDHNIKSFNTGTFMFVPNDKMRTHFIQVKEFGLKFTGKAFFDQSLANYYFNRLRIAKISPYMTKKLQMFPDITKYYPDKMLMHISGIGRYKQKAPIMKAYLEFIKHKKHIKI